MKIILPLILVLSFSAIAIPALAQFNPTPHPLERIERSECGVWVSVSGDYRLMIMPLSGSCELHQTQLRATLFYQHRPIARGLLNFSNVEFCGSLQTSGSKNIQLCVWLKDQSLYSNVRKDSPWQPFEIFSKETYY